MKNIHLVVMAAVLFTACNSADKEKQAETDIKLEGYDSLRTGNELNEATIAALDDAQIFSFTKSVPQFNWNRFQLTRFWKEDSLMTSTFEPDADYFENYGPLFKYSPDSTRFIDLDSYNISISKNKQGKRVGHPQGPDTEVSLVDLKTKQKSRLVFLGPGNNIEDASWLDNNNLLLVSSVDNEDSAANASVIKYNLPSRTFYVYETGDSSVIRNIRGYGRKERLKNIMLK